MATIKLEEITTQYRSFVPDQVLTAEQLNNIIDYFEDQNRLTRVCLSGVGIVCGLDVTFKSNKITVSEGCAVTTDGDLIRFDGQTFTNFRPFKDEDARYTKFRKFDAIEELIPSDSEDATTNNVLSKLADIDDKVVVLYLENYAKEQTPCTGVDCDTQGQEQIANIRILLLDKTEVLNLNQKDAIFTKHDTFENFLKLPEIGIKRVILSPANTQKYAVLMSDYIRAISNSPSPYTNLETGLISLFSEFNLLLETKDAQKKLRSILEQLKAIFTFSSKEIPLDIQYRYDFLKDVVDTYEEIKSLLFDLRVHCCASEEAFPKHILLGELKTALPYLKCRHSFYPSPIIPHGKDKLEEINSLLEKIYLMANSYDVEAAKQIEITPSIVSMNKLSERAVPYYYQPSSELLESWDIQKSRKFESRRNLSYHSDTYAKEDAIANPLDYCLDKHDFYRIEGHLGQDFFTALNEINKIKEEKGLSFDVKVLSINETLESIDPDDFACHFEDLSTVLMAFLKEQECLYKDITDFFTAFRTKEVGANAHYREEKEQEEREEAVEIPAKPMAKDQPLAYMKEMNYTGMKYAGAEYYTHGAHYYAPMEVVEENIYEKEEDALGKIIKQAIEKNYDREPETIIKEVEEEVIKIKEVQEAEVIVRDVAITFPYKLVIYSRTTSRLIPTRVSEINEERIALLSRATDRLCELVDNYQKAVTQALYVAGSKYQRRGFESRLELLLNQLTVNCCAAEKIKVLMVDIKKRKQEILAQKTLSKFVEKHPGLDHKAGVVPGGTFVMVYMGASETLPVKETENPIREEAIKKIKDGIPLREILKIEKVRDKLIFPLRDEIKKEERAPLEEIVVTGSRFPAENEILVKFPDNKIPGRNPIKDIEMFFPTGRNPVENIPQNTVVADFSLPYMCCSDCAPVNFIIPAQPVSLRLPKAFVCLDESTQPMLFEVVPADGEVTADVSQGANGGVTKNNDDKYVFDAKLLSEELYGQTIKFMVNGQITDAQIVVLQKPIFDFTFGDPKPGKNGITAEVRFTTVADNLPQGVTFEWDFGDGTLPSERFDENPRHIYDLSGQEGETASFKVSLTISNGRCKDTVSHILDIDITRTELEIPSEVCFDVTTEKPLKVPYKVKPEGAKLKLQKKVAEVSITKTDVVLGDRFRTFDTPIKFTVDGQEVKESLLVRQRPWLFIRVSQKDLVFDKNNEAQVRFRLDNQNNYDERLYKYFWEFGDNKTSKTMEPTHTFVAPKNTKPGEIVSYKTTLWLNGDACKEIKFEITLDILKREG